MGAAPVGIPGADWWAWPTSAKALILVQQEENDQFRQQLTALATELASLRELIGRTSRNSSKLPSTAGPGHRFAEALRPRKGCCCMCDVQQGHRGSELELLPVERCNANHHDRVAYCYCVTLLHAHDPEPHRRQVIEIPPITPVVKEYRLNSQVCPCCETRTCPELPADGVPAAMAHVSVP